MTVSTRSMRSIVERKKPPTKAFPKGRPPVYGTVTIHQYSFTRPCGHLHACDAIFHTHSMAAAHEAWARENTLCDTCAWLAKSPAQRDADLATRNPAWIPPDEDEAGVD